MKKPNERQPIAPLPGLPLPTWRQAYRTAAQFARLSGRRPRVVGAPVAGAPGRWAYRLENVGPLTVERLGNVPVRSAES